MLIHIRTSNNRSTAHVLAIDHLEFLNLVDQYYPKDSDYFSRASEKDQQNYWNFKKYLRKHFPSAQDKFYSSIELHRNKSIIQNRVQHELDRTEAYLAESSAEYTKVQGVRVLYESPDLFNVRIFNKDIQLDSAELKLFTAELSLLYKKFNIVV